MTNAVHSPRLERNIGYAWLPIELAEVGTKIAVEAPFGSATATVVPMPFFDPKKEVPKA